MNVDLSDAEPTNAAWRKRTVSVCSEECKAGRFAYAQSSGLQGSIATTCSWSLGDRSPNNKQRFERRRFLGGLRLVATSVDDLRYLPDMNWRRTGNSFITSFNFLPGGIPPPLNLYFGCQNDY